MTIQQQADAILARWPPKVVCAWCGVVLRDGPPHDVSHGVCEACAEKVVAESEAVA